MPDAPDAAAAPPPRLLVLGAGRMGALVAELARARGWPVIATLDRAALAEPDVVLGGLVQADVAIEFTHASVAGDLVRRCADAGIPVVSGTTGWSPEEDGTAAHVRAVGAALLWSPNFALGVHVFWRVCAEAARLLADRREFDAAVIETHHAAKVDAPSGTALRLLERVRAQLGRDVPATSVRVGSVPGTHELVLDAPFEQLRLVHEARDRRLFADGALAAAAWLRGRRGVFGMDDLLDSRP